MLTPICKALGRDATLQRASLLKTMGIARRGLQGTVPVGWAPGLGQVASPVQLFSASAPSCEPAACPFAASGIALSAGAGPAGPQSAPTFDTDTDRWTPHLKVSRLHLQRSVTPSHEGEGLAVKPMGRSHRERLGNARLPAGFFQPGFGGLLAHFLLEFHLWRRRWKLHPFHWNPDGRQHLGAGSTLCCEPQ